jgi:hypothetical protein
LHSYSHNFYSFSNLSASIVFSVSLAHISVVAFWLSVLFFHTYAISNFSCWVLDPLHVLPCSHPVFNFVGSSSINTYLGSSSSGLVSNSGLFHVLLSIGFSDSSSLRYLYFLSLFISLIFIYSGYFHHHISRSSGLNRKNKSISASISISTSLIALSLVSWSGHLTHLSMVNASRPYVCNTVWDNNIFKHILTHLSEAKLYSPETLSLSIEYCILHHLAIAFVA